MSDESTEIGAERLRSLLHDAAGDIARPRRDFPAGRQMSGRVRRWAIAMLVAGGVVAGTATGYAVGRGAGQNAPLPPSPSSLPAVVQSAMQLLLAERNPQIIQRVDSVEVRYVTDRTLAVAISSAWKTGRAADCGTFSGASAVGGHWYVILLHGDFVTRSVPGVPDQHGSLAVVMVPDSDFIARLRARTHVDAGTGPSLVYPPVDAGGEPLCWSLLVPTDAGR